MELLKMIQGSEVVYRLGWTLLHTLWLGAVVAALLAITLLILRRRSLNARYLAAIFVIGALFVNVRAGSTAPRKEATKPAAAGASSKGADGFEQLTLKIATGAKGALPLEPIPITITLLNATKKTVKARTSIKPNVGYLRIYVATGDQPFEEFRSADYPWSSVVLGERVLEPGSRHSRNYFLYYGNAANPSKERGRYLLRAPGVYRIKVELKDGHSKKQIESNVIKVEATKPIGDDAAAYDFLKSLEKTKDKDSTGRIVSYRRFLLSVFPSQRKVLEKQEEFISKFPNSRYSRYVCHSLGYTYRLGKNAKRGMQLLEKAGSYDDFFLAPRSLGLLVEACLKNGQLDKARKHLATMRKRFPGSPSTHEATVQVGKVASDPPPPNR